MTTLETIASHENVVRSILRVINARGSSPGIGILTSKHLINQKDLYAELVSRKLLNGSWQFLPAKHSEIPKGGGKMRTLSIPTTLDRVVEHAILGVIESLWDPTFSPFSYAFRANPKDQKIRGQHPAMWQMLRYMERGATHLVDMDLKQFFDMMNRDRLFFLLRERIEDERILKLIALRLKAGVMKNDDWVPTFIGVPQGGPLSPFLSNVYLDELDKTLTELGHQFVRYADDFRILKFNRPRAKNTYRSVTHLLEGRLRLKVNREKSSVCSAHASCFLGFEIRMDRRRIDVLVSAKARARRDAKIAELIANGDEHLLKSYWKGWLGYFDPLVTVKEKSLYR